jgi:hypothetical protein
MDPFQASTRSLRTISTRPARHPTRNAGGLAFPGPPSNLFEAAAMDFVTKLATVKLDFSRTSRNRAGGGGI